MLFLGAESMLTNEPLIYKIFKVREMFLISIRVLNGYLW